MCRAEAFLKLHQIDDAELCVLAVPKPESPSKSCSNVKFFGMLSEAYLHFVRAQYEMALGRWVLGEQINCLKLLHGELNQPRSGKGDLAN